MDGISQVSHDNSILFSLLIREQQSTTYVTLKLNRSHVPKSFCFVAISKELNDFLIVIVMRQKPGTPLTCLNEKRQT